MTAIAVEEKLIRNGIKYTDQLFKSIAKNIESAVYDSETYEEFLEKTRQYTVENPLIQLGAAEHAANSVRLAVAHTKFSFEANRKLTEQAIKDTTMSLVVRVGEDLRSDIRNIVLDGFKQNRLRNDVINDLTSRLNGNRNRARTIYRTEIKRAQTISNYISAKESGANAFYCNCRNPCKICRKRYNGGGKGSKTYDINNTSMLPPVHPNCRCTAVFFIDKNRKIS